MMLSVSCEIILIIADLSILCFFSILDIHGFYLHHHVHEGLDVFPVP